MVIIFSGISGSGKSTESIAFAKKTGAIRLSSDELRGVIGKSEEDLTVSAKVFQVMEWMTDYLLKREHSVVVDATMLNEKARAPFITLARKHGVKVKVFVMNTSLDECQKRNAARARKVPPFVIVNQHKRLQIPTKDEVDEVEILGDV
jgi:protein phosphatase